ncbi:MAG TPA: rRNA maturation RNase YbeY [Gemmatimonadales bacterium]|nr:rRNA maturation RNase YbeY [Gemmatimonadales bacterium]
MAGRSHPLARAAVQRAVEAVLRGEARTALVSVSFVGRDRMRVLNRRWKQRDQPTDVLAFALTGPGGAPAGDIYICPWVAAREARARGLPLRQELKRLVIHGVLHVLGYDHPDGPRRTGSPMWRRQERYVRGIR